MRKESPDDHDLSRSPSRITSVDRAMTLLRLLMERGELGVSDAAAELGVAPSTTHRLLATMADHGFVAHGPGRRYRLGPLLSSQPQERSAAALIELLQPVLRELFNTIGETVHLMMLAGADIRFIDGIEGHQARRIGLRIGARLPAYCTSGGKAMLAELDDEVVAALHARGLRPWPGRKLRTLPELQRELAQIRATRIAYNQGESERGVRALGVAVGPVDGRPVAGITVSLPADRYAEVDERELIRALLKARTQARRLL